MTAQPSTAPSASEHIDMCILCGTPERTSYAEEAGYQSVQCPHCGLVWCTPRPTIAEMKALYQGQETKVNLYDHITSRDKKSVEARRSLGFIRKHCTSGRLLEIGSAAGYFLYEAKAAGFDVQGLDITRQFCEFSRDVLGVPSHEGILRDAPFEPESFDVIYHRNVLSHLAYPVEEIAKMRALLKPGGVMVFETGNVGDLPADDAGFLELPDHLFHFSAASIRKLLEAAGFQWLETRKFRLAGQLPGIKWLGRAADKLSTAKPKTAAQVKQPPSQLPDSKFAKRAQAHLAQFVRYDVGGALPKGGRCTLVVAAQRPAS